MAQVKFDCFVWNKTTVCPVKIKISEKSQIDITACSSIINLLMKLFWCIVREKNYAWKKFRAQILLVEVWTFNPNSVILEEMLLHLKHNITTETCTGKNQSCLKPLLHVYSIRLTFK